MLGTCSCGAKVEVVRDNGALRFKDHSCGRPLAGPSPLPKPGLVAWSAAKPGTCPLGHRHGSKLEIRACGVVHGDLQADERLHVHPRIPCWAMEPDAKGTLYFTPDFVVVGPAPDGRMSLRRVYDAKGRASPEWRRGVAAFRSTYGVEVLEIR